MKGWVPRQHGVWAMMLAPAITGGVIASFSWQHALLIMAWLSAYLCFMAVRGWIRRGRGEYALPSVTYAVVCLVSVSVVVWWHPALIWWAIPLGVLLGSSLFFIVADRERTVANDALLIAASCVMAVVTATSANLGVMSWTAVRDTVLVPQAWVVAGVFAGYFWGTIFYVKTMIRERGKLTWYATSVAYHLGYVVPAFMVNYWVGAVSVVIGLRAAVVPRVWPKLKPLRIGVGEITISIVMAVVLCLTMRI
jgi:hypothetical protein